MRWILVVCALLCCCPRAYADELAGEPHALAEFERAVALLERGDIEQAIVAFEAAHRAAPHHRVLFNLGQAYASLGRPVESIAAFERYLVEARSAIDETRRRQITEIIGRLQRRVGFLVLETTSGVEVSIDGRVVGHSPFVAALAVAAGMHSVVGRKAGHQTVVTNVQVHPGLTQRLELRLERESPIVAAVGQLSVRCAVPEMELLVDGRLAGRTPRRVPWLVPTGPRSVSLRRSGYRTITRTVDVSPARAVEVACDPRPLADGSSAWGTFQTETDPSRADVRVNGRTLVNPRLPLGVHHLRIYHEGYEPFESLIEIRHDRPTSLQVALTPTAQRIRELRMLARRRKHWALGLAGAGVTLTGAATATLLWNSDRYEQWQLDRDAARRQAPHSGGAPSLSKRAANLQRVDDLAILAGAAAGVALTAAVLTWMGAWQP